MDREVRNREICRGKIIDGLTNVALGAKYDLSEGSIRNILKSESGRNYLNQYRRQLEEIAKETINTVKRQAGRDALGYYDRLKDMTYSKKEIVCPECNHVFEIEIGNATTLRAILSAMGVAGIKIKHEEDIQPDLPKLTIHTKKKAMVGEQEKRAG